MRGTLAGLDLGMGMERIILEYDGPALIRLPLSRTLLVRFHRESVPTLLAILQELRSEGLVEFRATSGGNSVPLE